MKFLASFSLMICMAVASVLSGSESTKSLSLVESKQPHGIEKFKFEDLPRESTVGGLAAAVTKGKSTSSISTEVLRGKGKMKKRIKILSPYAEDLLYINGELCHVANYPRSVIYTVLEGPYYGTQTTMTYDGVILYVNYDFEFEETFDGVIFYHYYDDSVVITGANQVIKFY